MIKLIRISYDLNDGKSFQFGIAADSKEKAIDFLKRNVKNFRTVHSISTDGDIHAIEDDIIKRVEDQYTTKIEKEKEESGKEKEESGKEKEKIYCCPFCNKEASNSTSIKKHIGQKHRGKIED